MTTFRVSRRAALTGAAALGAASLVPGGTSAQQAGRAASLPARRDILIRGANVLTMDDKIPDLASGDVLIRNGAIVFEGWAPDLESAARLAASGGVQFHPNHHFDAVGPMTGMTTRGQMLMVVENKTFGNLTPPEQQRRFAGAGG